MLKTRRTPSLNLLCIATALAVVAVPWPSLAGKDEARTILDRSAAFHAGLQSARVKMEVRMEMPEGVPRMPGSGPEHYAVAMSRPQNLAMVADGDFLGASFIQNDEQAYGESPMFKRYVLAEATPFDRMTGENGNEALAVPGSEVLLGLVGSGEGGSATFDGKAKLLGEEAVDGVDCHHLSLKGPEGRAELWIARGEQPWLMRHRTEAPEMPKMPDKDESGAMAFSFMPGFDIHFSGWEANPDLTGAFEIRPREGFTKAETLYPPPEEMGALFGGLDGPGGEHPSVGEPAPEVSLRSEGNDAIELSSLKGKVVVLDFWATWCQPCVVELPLVDEVTDARSDKGVVFYAVNTGESRKAVKKFLEQKNLDVPLVLDDDGVIASAYGVNALPHLVIIDAEGTVRHVHLGSGPGTEQRLATELDALLPE